MISRCVATCVNMIVCFPRCQLSGYILPCTMFMGEQTGITFALPALKRSTNTYNFPLFTLRSPGRANGWWWTSAGLIHFAHRTRTKARCSTMIQTPNRNSIRLTLIATRLKNGTLRARLATRHYMLTNAATLQRYPVVLTTYFQNYYLNSSSIYF